MFGLCEWNDGDGRMRSEKEKIKEYVGIEIYNYIDYFTSNESERDKMKIVADRYMQEIYGDE